MKKSKKIFIALAFWGLSVGATTTFAQTWQIGATPADNVTATISGSGDNLTLTIDGTGNMQDFDPYTLWREWNIKSNITDLVINEGVTNIGNYAFYYCSNLTGTLIIPNSVTEIRELAFAGCTGFTGTLTIPNSVTSIRDYAFDDCYGLTTVTIPYSVTEIEDAPFRGCSGLTAINVDANNQYYSSDNGILYNKNKTDLIECPAGKTGTVTIPNSVTTIKDWAFGYCGGLTEVTIPTSVTQIGGFAFSYCYGLTEVIIPNSVTHIGYNTFGSCTGLTEVTIPNSVTSIEIGAFGGCYGLTSITCNAIVPPVLGSYTFNNVSNTISVYVPCGSVTAYQGSGWGNYFTNITKIIGSCPFANVTLYVNNSMLGSVSGDGRHDLGTTATLFAIPKAGNIFIGWLDGNTENPRTITVTQDTTFTANFAIVPVCDNTALLAKIAGLELDTALFKSQIRTLTVDNNTCNQNATVLNGQLSTANNHIIALQNDSITSHNAITNLTNQLNICRTDSTDLEKDLSECRADSANLAQMLYECEHLGIETPHSSPLKIYPNPVQSNGKLNIENEALKAGDKIEIFDMNGKLISINFATGTENSINIGNLPQGTYLLRLAGKRGVKFEVR